MRILPVRHPFEVLAVVALLVGCSSEGSPQFSPPNDMPPNAAASMLIAGSLVHTPVASDEQVAGDAMVVRPDRTPSWMAPDIKGQSLLYVTDFSGGEVFVYSYPQGKLVGQLTGLNEPNGACVDKTGDVWIADTGASKIVEYKHGGKWPIKTLDDAGNLPLGCAVNPNDGDLAVSNKSTLFGEPGNVLIYKSGRGKPAGYWDWPFMYNMYFLSYDDKGDIFVDGKSAGFFRFAELPAGSRTFTNIYLNRAVYFPGGVQWEGSYVAVGDQEYGFHKPGTSAIDKVEVSGSSGTIIGAVVFKGKHDIVQFWIQGKSVVGPDAGWTSNNIYSYPTGRIQKEITGNPYPIGAVVSESQTADRQ
jgi:hypothetical protein